MNINKWFKRAMYEISGKRFYQVTYDAYMKQKDAEERHSTQGVSITHFIPCNERQYSLFHKDNKHDYFASQSTVSTSIVSLLASFKDNFPQHVIIKSADVIKEQEKQQDEIVYWRRDTSNYYLYNDERVTYNEILNALRLEVGSIKYYDSLANLINNIPKLFMTSWYDESEMFEDGRDNWTMAIECLETIGECANTRVLVKALPLVHLNNDSDSFEGTEKMLLEALTTTPLRYLAMTKVTPEQQVKADIVTAIFDHDTVKANELLMLLGNLEKPEYTELRGKA